MKNFKGFDDWIPIFRGGKQIDSDGKEHDGDNLIDLAVKSFDPEHHEPPVVVGHPKNNAPAFGWIEQLKTEIKSGIKTLYARFKDVVPEFAAAVKSGLYKKRSASFYPDGRLRHVGFLGAAPPAVKGLADLKFKDDDEAISFDFYDPGMDTVGRIFRSLRDWLIEKEGKEKADEVIPDWDVEYIRDQANKNDETQTGEVPAFGGAANGVIDDRGQAANSKEGKMTFKDFMEAFKFWKQVEEKDGDVSLPAGSTGQTGSAGFSEADLEAAKKEAEAETRRTVEAEFAEKARQSMRDARRAEISTWCDTMVKEGKLTPALVKYGVPEMLFDAAGRDDVIEFGLSAGGSGPQAGETKEKATHYDRFKGMFETELPKLVDFKEIATRDKDTGGGDAAGKLDGLTRKKMSENKDLAYGQAFSEVQRENPDLAQEYRQEMVQAA